MNMVGGCLCGNIRYQIDGKALFTALCHCTHCQKQSGSAFSIIVAVGDGALSVEGKPEAYADRSDNGRAVTREFCSNCGSALFSIGDGAPGVVFVKAGTLDDTTMLAPQMELWTDSAQPWVKLDLHAKRFARQPE